MMQPLVLLVAGLAVCAPAVEPEAVPFSGAPQRQTHKDPTFGVTLFGPMLYEFLPLKPSAPEMSDLAAQQRLLADMLRHLEQANDQLPNAAVLERDRPAMESMLRQVEQGKTVPPRTLSKLLRDLDMREQVAMERIAWLYKTQAHQTLRENWEQFSSRSTAWDKLLSDWEAAGSPGRRRYELTAWLMAAMRNSAPGSLATLPQLPQFQSLASAPPAQVQPPTSSAPSTVADKQPSPAARAATEPLAAPEADRPAAKPAAAASDAQLPSALAALTPPSVPAKTPAAAQSAAPDPLVRQDLLPESALSGAPSAFRPASPIETPRPNVRGRAIARTSPSLPNANVQSHRTLPYSVARIAIIESGRSAPLLENESDVVPQQAHHAAGTAPVVEEGAGDRAAFLPPIPVSQPLDPTRFAAVPPVVVFARNSPATDRRPVRKTPSAPQPLARAKILLALGKPDLIPAGYATVFRPTSPPTTGGAKVNLTELSARIISNNIDVQALAIELEQGGRWTADRISHLVARLQLLATRGRDLTTVYQLLSAEEQRMVAPPRSPQELVPRLGTRIFEARSYATGPDFRGSPPDRDAELKILDQLSQALVDLSAGR